MSVRKSNASSSSSSLSSAAVMLTASHCSLTSVTWETLASSFGRPKMVPAPAEPLTTEAEPRETPRRRRGRKPTDRVTAMEGTEAWNGRGAREASRLL